MGARTTAPARLGAVVGVLLVLGLLTAALTPSLAARGQVGVDPVPPTAAVPAAECGPGSRPETGLQGQVPRADRDSGRSLEGYQCNLEGLGGHQHGEGASWQFAWYEHCAYYGTLDTPERKTPKGAVVVDVSDPANPVETAVLDTPAVNDPHESLKVEPRRGLLGAVDLDDPFFDVYDVSKDCARPELLASVDVGGTGHEGEWTADGRTYYGAPSNGMGNVFAVDVTDPRNPTRIHTLPRAAHGLSLSADGNRAYLTSLATRQGPNGLVIVDVSEIQARTPNPSTPVVGEVYWADGALAQHTIPISVAGRQYLVAVDEAARGAARIIDITDETQPAVVSKLKLEVHLPQYEAVVRADSDEAIFTYDGHYCSTDRLVEATTLACGYFESGIRVFDIRDPLEPKEIAYYNPPAITDRPLPGSSHGGGPADHCSAQVRLLPSVGQLWTQCQDNEMLTLKFTNGVYPTLLPSRSLVAACPEEGVPAAGYGDVPAESVHARAIDCVTAYRVAQGKSASSYDPAGSVTRGQMASFVVRMMEAAGTTLEPGADRFSDDAGSPHEAAINKLANAGIVSGTGGSRYSPDAPVTRAQVATILTGGYEKAAGKALVTDDDWFADDAASVHEEAINKLTGAAIVAGTGVNAFAPDADVQRDQMASLLARTLAQLTQDGKVTPPSGG